MLGSSFKRRCIESETGLSVLARLESRPSLCGLEPTLIPEGPKPGDVIEVRGCPGTGKSMLVLHMVLSVLLPRTWKGIRLGGCEGGVIFVDNDAHFNILQFENMVRKKVSIIVNNCISSLKGRGDGACDSCDLIESTTELWEFVRLSKQCFREELDKLTKQCLKNLLYLRGSDSNQFVVTLLSINDLLLNNSNVSLVVIDSVSAYYWYDRSYRSDTWYKLEQFYNKIFKVFLAHIKKYKIVLVSTRHSLFEKKNRDSFSLLKNQLFHVVEREENLIEYEYLGKEWSKAVSCRIGLSVINSPVLSVGTEVFGENSLEQSSKEISLNSLNDSLDSVKGKGGSVKMSSNRTVYCAEVADKEKKNRLTFVVHEEGIRWLNGSNLMSNG